MDVRCRAADVRPYITIYFLHSTVHNPNDPARVTIMDLSGRYLKAIPESIFDYNNLLALNLTDNSLEHIPDEIGWK